MQYLPRHISRVCLKGLKSFPVLTLTGPRQSGKSTLLKHLLPGFKYVNLEEPSSLEFALEDPKGFLKTHGDRVVIDEIQRAPQLLSQIQVNVDKDRKPGKYALSGSHNLMLLESVSQSLAGRTVICHLLPFSLSEIKNTKFQPSSLEQALYRGGYPPVFDIPEDIPTWLDSYIQTYVERDVRTIRNVSDLSTFRRFLKLCAGRAGQLLDLSALGGDCGITHNTARDWIGVLEACFIVFRLEPYFQHFSKRVIKSPKLYFYDTGLLCRLLGIQAQAQLLQHPFRGAVFENWCALEILKWYLNRGEQPNLHFWRDQRIDVDLLVQLNSNKVAALECKSGLSSAQDFLDTPLKFQSFAKKLDVIPGAIFGGEQSQHRTKGVILSWRTFLEELVRY